MVKTDSVHCLPHMPIFEKAKRKPKEELYFMHLVVLIDFY